MPLGGEGARRSVSTSANVGPNFRTPIDHPSRGWLCRRLAKTAAVMLKSASMAKRRSLTPALGSDGGQVHATRRGTGGARRESADRVFLRNAGTEHTGWALNASRGGIRIILEDKVELGSEYEVEIGAGNKRRGRVVWVQEETDGMIVGVEFIDQKLDGDTPPPGPPKDD